MFGNSSKNCGRNVLVTENHTLHLNLVRCIG